MIAYLSGIIHSITTNNLILATNGVGYLLYATKGLLERAKTGSQLELFVYTNVRENELSLYGFETADEWRFFKQLLTVAGVGPKIALEILNAPLSRVRQAIVKKDAAFLTHIPGIGKKTAERVILDLEGKLKLEALEEIASHPEHGEIVDALIAMGYQRNHVLQGLKKIPAEIEREEDIIKYFLQNS